ncbi:MAG: hypothetical protein OHK93_005330 [Ramalina farinacea]|uniref:Uncharacterized protein n=1 Tax=Ramalina farinacea TaxID=258253 RepID=A0AA43QVX2_9LECA|nr:hypothetical protein [Ramalina farinacea]
MSAAAEETSPFVPKQHKPWRPIDEGKGSPDCLDVANRNLSAAAYRWSKEKREREESNSGGDQRNQSYSTSQKGIECRKQSTDSSSVKESVENDLQDLFNRDYDLSAPFEQNIRILNDKKRHKDGNALNRVSDGSPSRKRPRTTKQGKAKGNEKAVVCRTHGYDQPVSQTLVSSKNGQASMDVPYQRMDTPAYDKPRLADSPTGTAAKATEPAFDPPKAPRAHFLLKRSSPHVQSQEIDSYRSHHFQHSSSNKPHGSLRVPQGLDSSVIKTVSTTSSAPHAVPESPAPDEGGNQSVKAPLEGCNCNLPPFFTAHYHRVPNLNNWTGEKEDFFRHVRNIANCKSHPFNIRGACRSIVKSHEASVSRQNEVQLFRATDLSRGIFSNKNGSYEIHRGRSQSTIAPDNFYVSARNANQGELAERLKADISNISVASQQCTPESLSPDRVSRRSPSVSDNKRHGTPFRGLGKSRSLANATSASSAAGRQDSVDSIYKQRSQSSSGWSFEGNGPSTPKTESISTVREGQGEKEVEGVINWAMNCLERDSASSQSPQSMIQDVGPHEEDHSTQVSPRKPDQSLRQNSLTDFSSRAKRHQSLPARLATPGPVAVKSSQTPRDRVKAFAKEHLAKVPNLSLVDIKRVVEELDRRLTNIEADKEASRSMRSSDGPENENPASTFGASANVSSSTSVATPASGFRPINRPVSNACESTNAMPPPPLPRKPKSKSIAQQKLEKPELSPDVPQDERLPEADIIDLGRRKLAYARHESAPYAFNYRGKLRKEYRYLLTKVGPDGKTVWIAEEVSRLS